MTNAATPPAITVPLGGSADVTYTVTYARGAPAPSSGQLSGTIGVANTATDLSMTIKTVTLEIYGPGGPDNKPIQIIDATCAGSKQLGPAAGTNYPSFNCTFGPLPVGQAASIIAAATYDEGGYTYQPISDVVDLGSSSNPATGPSACVTVSESFDPVTPGKTAPVRFSDPGRRVPQGGNVCADTTYTYTATFADFTPTDCGKPLTVSVLFVHVDFRAVSMFVDCDMTCCSHAQGETLNTNVRYALSSGAVACTEPHTLRNDVNQHGCVLAPAAGYQHCYSHITISYSSTYTPSTTSHSWFRHASSTRQ